MNLPKYKCHKIVQAGKIMEIDSNDEEDPVLFLEEVNEPVVVSEGYMYKHKPQIGGYFVVYENSYRSYSPADAFTSGYLRVEE